MITQKTICVKLNKTLLSELEQESNVSGINRNKLINYAVYKYIRNKDSERQLKCGLISEKVYINRCLTEPKF